MRIVLLRPLPDSSRWSMNVYHEELLKAFRGLLASDEELMLFPSAADLPQWSADLETSQGKIKRYWQQYIHYGRKARELNADLYHVTDHGYAHVIPFLKGRKTIVTFHDALLPNLAAKKIPIHFQPRSAIWAQRYCLACMGAASGVIAISDFSKKEFLHYCGKARAPVETIYLGVGEGFGRPSSGERLDVFRKKWNLENQQVILMVGRTDPHKNVEGALRVFHHLKTQLGHPAILLKFGSPLTSGQHQMIRELGLQAHVRELGFLNSSEIPIVYKASHALLLLSLYEGFGFPALEAMAAGVPVVVSNRGSLPEIVAEAGLMVEPFDFKKAAQTLFVILTDIKLRQTLIDKGIKRAADFSWKETARKTLGFYRSLYKGRQSD